jgi:CDP-paratose 2-epimerase
VFNIGGGMENSLSLLELFSLLEGIVGIKMQYRNLPPRESDQRVFVADVTKASRLLGWKPRVTAAEGIRQMLEWTSDALMAPR